MANATPSSEPQRRPAWVWVKRVLAVLGILLVNMQLFFSPMADMFSGIARWTAPIDVAAAALKGMGPRQLRALDSALAAVSEPLPLQSLVEVAGAAQLDAARGDGGAEITWRRDPP